MRPSLGIYDVKGPVLIKGGMMKNKPKKGKSKFTPEYYIEIIILKLDRIEAELETVKSVVFGYGKQTRLLNDRIENIEERKKLGPV